MKEQLLTGDILKFGNFNDEFNSVDCFFIKDDVREWVTGFKIEHNGILIASFKRFDAFERKLNLLIKEFDLEQIFEIEDFEEDLENLFKKKFPHVNLTN